MLFERKIPNYGFLPSAVRHANPVFINKVFWILEEKQPQTANVGSGSVVITTHYYSRTHRFPSLKYSIKKPNLFITFICGEAWGMRGITNLYLCNLMFFCNYPLAGMPVVLWIFNMSGFVHIRLGKLLVLLTVNFPSLVFDPTWHPGFSLCFLRSLLFIRIGWSCLQVEVWDSERDCDSGGWQHSENNFTLLSPSKPCLEITENESQPGDLLGPLICSYLNLQFYEFLTFFSFFQVPYFFLSFNTFPLLCLPVFCFVFVLKNDINGSPKCF